MDGKEEKLNADVKLEKRKWRPQPRRRKKALSLFWATESITVLPLTSDSYIFKKSPR